VEPPATTEVARPRWWLIFVTGASNTTLEPWASTSARHRSHIIPGPRVLNLDEARDLLACPFAGDAFRIGSQTAVQRVMPF
jgi:hypothetical protein